MRRYGVWNGNPRGVAEDPTRCIAEVWETWSARQCARKRGYGPDGLYCKVHGKKADKRKLWEQIQKGASS